MPGYLRRFAKNQKYSGRSETVTAKIPKELHEKFTAYCSDLRLSISEAIFHLIEKELEADKKTDTDVLMSYTNVYQKDTNVQTNKPNRKPLYTSVRGSRFSTVEWQVNGRLPCPICETWQSSANFARHAKSHGMTTQEMFEQYKDKADEMVRKINE